MEMLKELEWMIKKYSTFEKDSLIAEFLEELIEIKESISSYSKSAN